MSLEEKEILSKMTEEEIEALFNAEDDNAGFLYKEGLRKVRKLNKQIIDNLKKYIEENANCVGKSWGKSTEKKSFKRTILNTFRNRKIMILQI